MGRLPWRWKKYFLCVYNILYKVLLLFVVGRNLSFADGTKCTKNRYRNKKQDKQ